MNCKHEIESAHCAECNMPRVKHYTHRNWEALKTQLVEELSDSDGMTIYEIAGVLEVPVQVAREVVVRVRRDQAKAGTVYLVCNPQSKGQPWLYEYTGIVTVINGYNTRRRATTASHAESTADGMQVEVRHHKGRRTSEANDLREQYGFMRAFGTMVREHAEAAL